MNDTTAKAEALRRKCHLLTAVSALSVSLGVTILPPVAQGDTPGAVSGEHKTDSQQVKGQSHQLKYDSRQIKGQSNQIKLDSQHLKLDSQQHKLNSQQLKLESHQYKETNAHMLNPQPLPPG